MDWSKIGDWASGITDRARDDYWRERNENQLRANMEYNTAVQREFAQNGVRWRVQDAIAAGLHPLYALGGGGATFSPGASVSDGGVSSHATGGPSQQLYETGAQRELRMANLNALKASASKDEAQAALYASEAARNYQQMNAGPRTLLDEDGVTSGGGKRGAIPSDQQFAPGNVNAIDLQAPQIIAARGNDHAAGAGEQPAWQETVFAARPNGEKFSLWMPLSPDGEGWGESTEGVFPTIAVIAKNVAEGKAYELLRYMSSPAGDWLSELAANQAAEAAYRRGGSSRILGSSGRERGVNWRSNRMYFFGR